MRLPGVEFNSARARCRAFSLVDVIIATAIVAFGSWGVVYGYVTASQHAELTGYLLAGQSLATQRMEQARSAKWDPQAVPTVDELVSTNFPVVIDKLDIPLRTNTPPVYATSVTTIATISLDPPLKMVRVETTWRIFRRGLFTNSIATYRAPDKFGY